jgi:nucleoside-diphosphate-sugar epimerase
MARIVIAGCGDVGTTLGNLLNRSGHEVWGLKRNPQSLPPTIKPLAADLTRPESLAVLPAAIDYVFYAAAAGGFNEQQYRAAYCDGVHNLIAVLYQQSQDIKRFFFVSSTSVYAQSAGEWIDEDSPAEAAGFSGESLRAGENLLWQSRYPGTVVRFAGIYGPGRTRLIDSVFGGTASCVANVYSNRIHRDDCARMLQHLLQLQQPESLYLGVDDAPVLQCEVLQWLAARLGVAGPGITTVSAADRAGRARMGSNKRCSNTRLKTSGFAFTYPSYREGYAALLASGGFVSVS